MTYHDNLIGKIAEVLKAVPADHPFPVGATGVVVCVDDDGSVWVRFDTPADGTVNLYVIGDEWDEGETFYLRE